jgi:hypothetical protein
MSSWAMSATVTHCSPVLNCLVSKSDRIETRPALNLGALLGSEVSENPLDNEGCSAYG